MPSILMVPSSMFYQDRLIPAARDVRLLRWSQMPNPHIPILFRGTESEEYCIDEVCLSIFYFDMRMLADQQGAVGSPSPR